MSTYYQVTHDSFNSQSVGTSDNAVFTSYFVTYNKYGANMFCAFLAVKATLPKVSADWLFKIPWNTWYGLIQRGVGD